MSNRNPYVGPDAFTPEDAPFFFGRGRDAEMLLSLMISNRIVLFYAQSGAGKTSLLNARLVPGLEEEGFTVLPIIRVGRELEDQVKPDNVYVFNTLQYLSGGTERDTAKLAMKSLAVFLRGDVDSESQDEAPRVLVLDQFEEILTTYPERWQEREGFFRQLSEALESDPLLSVLFSMREDHIAGLDPYATLLPDRLRARFRMERLRFPEAVKAVRGPAEKAGRRFVEGVAETLVNDLRQEHIAGHKETIAGEFVEPVQLQVVCYQLWENLRGKHDGVITEEDLDASGDVNDALRNFYEGIVKKVSGRTRVSELRIRRFFSKTLITPLGIRAQVNRQPQKTGSLPNPVLDHLLNEHLLRREVVRGGVWYELVHDRFIEPILASNAGLFKRRRNRRLAVAALAWTLIILLAAGSWARLRAREARCTKAVALSREAVELLDNHPPRSLWLAREAARTTYAVDRELLPEAREALRKALQRTRARMVGYVRSGDVKWLSLDDKGEQLATLDEDGKLTLWDVASGQETWSLEDHRASIAAAAFSADGSRLAAVDENWEVTIWDVPRRLELLQFSLDPELLSSSLNPELLSLSLDLRGMRLVTVSPDDTVSAWDVRSGRKIFWLSDPDNGYVDAAFGPGKMRLAVARVNGEVEVWQPDLNQQELSLFNDEVPAVEFSPDGQTLFSVSKHGRVQRWDYSAAGPPFESKAPAQLHLEYPPRAIALDADGRKLFLVLKNGDVKSWDLYSRSISDILYGNEDTAVAAFSRDGSRFAIHSSDGSTGVWESLWDDASGVFRGHEASVYAMTFGHDGELLASGSDDGTVRIWNTRSKKTLRLINEHTERVNAIDLSSDDRLVATASDDKTARVWNPSKRTGLVLSGHSNVVSAVAFSPDDGILATASWDGTAKLWNVATGIELLTVSETGGKKIYSLAFHPDGEIFGTGGPAGVRLWEVETGRERRAYDDLTSDVTSLAFNPDGKSFAAASKDGSVTIRELRSQRKQTLAGHYRWVNDLAFSPDGRRLASCDSTTVTVWEMQSGLQALSLPSSGTRCAVAFQPDGSRIAIAGKAASIRLEPVDDAELVRLADERVNIEPPSQSTP